MPTDTPPARKPSFSLRGIGIKSDAMPRIRTARPIQNIDFMTSLSGLSADSEAAYAAPQSDGLQDPYSNENHHDDVQNRLDAGSHRDKTIDQPQRHADDDQR